MKYKHFKQALLFKVGSGFKPGKLSVLKPFFVCILTPEAQFFHTFATESDT